MSRGLPHSSSKRRAYGKQCIKIAWVRFPRVGVRTWPSDAVLMQTEPCSVRVLALPIGRRAASVTAARSTKTKTEATIGLSTGAPTRSRSGERARWVQARAEEGSGHSTHRVRTTAQWKATAVRVTCPSGKGTAVRGVCLSAEPCKMLRPKIAVVSVRSRRPRAAKCRVADQ
jgi:hypothetical protein